jgi:chemotaxis protein MotB
MKTIVVRSVAAIVLGTTLVSCVPLPKFNTLRQNNMYLQSKNDSLMLENKKLNILNTENSSRIEILTKEMEEMVKDSLALSAEVKRSHSEVYRLQKQLQELQDLQETLMQGSARETTRLLRQLQVTQEELQQREDKLRASEAELRRKQSELEIRNARLGELEIILARKDSVVLALRQTISNALRGFEKDGLSVFERNGKVYVSLDEKLLFQTGSTVVDPKGVSALKNLARVLEQNPDISIMIEGHTDDVPVIPGPVNQDNWDLSVRRATAVVRILLEGSKINPARLIASGRGEYIPLDKAKTTESRQKNRRTEIILTPKLDDLFKVMETN